MPFEVVDQIKLLAFIVRGEKLSNGISEIKKLYRLLLEVPQLLIKSTGAFEDNNAFSVSTVLFQQSKMKYYVKIVDDDY